MKRHFRIYEVLINEYVFHKDVPNFSRYCQILHSCKKTPSYTKQHCCYLLYKTALLQQHCTPVQCEPLLKLIGVVSEDAEYPVVERLTMCGECPSPPGSPERCDNGEGAMGRYVTGSISSSSGTQLSSDSFHSAAWPQAPFLKRTQASSCPWT